MHHCTLVLVTRHLIKFRKFLAKSETLFLLQAVRAAMVDNIINGIQARLGSSQAQTSSDSDDAVCQAVADRLLKEVLPPMVEQQVTLLSVNVSEQASIITLHIPGRFAHFAVHNPQSQNLICGRMNHMQHETVLTCFPAIL